MRITPAPGRSVDFPGTSVLIPAEGVDVDITLQAWQYLLRTGDIVIAAGAVPVAAASGYAAWAVLPQNSGRTIFDWVEEMVVAAFTAAGVSYVDSHGLGAATVQAALDVLAQRAGGAPAAVGISLAGDDPSLSAVL